MAFTFYTKDQIDTLLADYLTSASASATYLTSATASATYLPKSGGTLSGQVYFAQTPDNQYSLVNRKYVDDAIQSAVFGTITNFTIPGDLVVGGTIEGAFKGNSGSNAYEYEYSEDAPGQGMSISDPFIAGIYTINLIFPNDARISLGTMWIDDTKYCESSIGIDALSNPMRLFQLNYNPYAGGLPHRHITLYVLTINGDGVISTTTPNLEGITIEFNLIVKY